MPTIQANTGPASTDLFLNVIRKCRAQTGLSEQEYVRQLREKVKPIDRPYAEKYTVYAAGKEYHFPISLLPAMAKLAGWDVNLLAGPHFLRAAQRNNYFGADRLRFSLKSGAGLYGSGSRHAIQPDFFAKLIERVCEVRTLAEFANDAQVDVSRLREYKNMGTVPGEKDFRRSTFERLILEKLEMSRLQLAGHTLASRVAFTYGEDGEALADGLSLLAPNIISGEEQVEPVSVGFGKEFQTLATSLGFTSHRLMANALKVSAASVGHYGTGFRLPEQIFMARLRLLVQRKNDADLMQSFKKVKQCWTAGRIERGHLQKLMKTKSGRVAVGLAFRLLNEGWEKRVPFTNHFGEFLLDAIAEMEPDMVKAFAKKNNLLGATLAYYLNGQRVPNTETFGTIVNALSKGSETKSIEGRASVTLIAGAARPYRGIPGIDLKEMLVCASKASQATSSQEYLRSCENPTGISEVSGE